MVPKAPGNRCQTRDTRLTGGGKAVPVKEEERQQRLKFVAAENLRQRGAEGRRDEDRSTSRLQKVRKTKSKPKRVGPARMEEAVECLEEAFEKVAANQGAPGPDRQSIEYVREHLQKLLVELRVSLLDGSYRPGDIRRVWIPKAGGGQRGLGIPTVSAYCTSYNTASESSGLSFRILEERWTQASNSCSFSAQSVIQYGDPALSLRASISPRSIQ